MKLSERLKTDRYMTPDGRIVFTEGFLLKQGRCCGLGCLHCPYDPLHEAGNANVRAEMAALLENRERNSQE